jgi:hypothetical protein
VVGSTVVVGAIVVAASVDVDAAVVVEVDEGCETGVAGSAVVPDVDEQPAASAALAERRIRSLRIPHCTSEGFGIRRGRYLATNRAASFRYVTFRGCPV